METTIDVTFIIGTGSCCDGKLQLELGSIGCACTCRSNQSEGDESISNALAIDFGQHIIGESR